MPSTPHRRKPPPMAALSKPFKPSPFTKPSPPPLRTLLVKICIVLFTGFFLLSTLINDRHLSKWLFLKSSPPPIPDDLCHIIGTNPDADDLWQFNTRSHCISSHICVAPGAIHYSSDPANTQCKVLSPQLTPKNRSFPALVHWHQRTCERFQREFVWNMHAEGMQDSQDGDVQVKWIGEGERVWIEGVSIIVPHYPWPWNIYHYASVVTDVVRVVKGLDKLLGAWDGGRRSGGLNLVFQGPRTIPYTEGRWQRDLLRIVKGWMAKRRKVTVYHMEDLGMACVKTGVVLGNRGHDNVWPFLNETDVVRDGREVGRDAVEFKRIVYEGVGIEEEVLEAPPLVVGYARRAGKKGSDGLYRWGSGRRLGEEDEIWLTGMLRNETGRVGGEVRVLDFDYEPLEEQVKAFEGVGLVVGIHGANLVNSIWMRPFGALMEIIPKGGANRCYWGGLNGGLKYWGFEASEMASIEESACDPQDESCKGGLGRMVKLSLGDRERLRRTVQEGLQYLVQVRQRYRGVKYDEDRMVYELV